MINRLKEFFTKKPEVAQLNPEPSEKWVTNRGPSRVLVYAPTPGYPGDLKLVAILMTGDTFKVEREDLVYITTGRSSMDTLEFK